MGVRNTSTGIVQTSSGVVQTIPDSGVSRWKHEDNSDANTAVDSWGGNDGTIQGASYTTDAKVGDYSLNFDGTDDYVEYGDVDELAFERTDPFSIAAWIYPTDSDGNGTIISKQNGNNEPEFNGWRLRVNNGSKILNNLYHDSADGDQLRVQTTDTYTVNAWNHIGFSYDGSSSASGVSFYIDGQDAGSDVIEDALTDTIAATNATAYAGRREYGNIYYQGHIDDLRVYSRELTSSEFSDIYNNTK